MNKILYYSLVDWNWIKQRPQYIALDLAERGFTLRAMYLRQYRKRGLSEVSPGKVQLHPIYRIPSFNNQFPWLNRLNRWIVHRAAVREIRRFQPDVIWLTHPSQLADVPDTFTGKIVYDCMDDYDVLGIKLPSGEDVVRQERKLCARADLIFVSSSVLQKKICGRNPESAERVHLVRNGCNGKGYPRAVRTPGEKIRAGYVGTVAEWFDFDLVLESLERIPNLEYYLIGPVLAENPPAHARIHYLGTVAHRDLFEKVEKMDCLVMPFRLTDVVYAVDPVKLYEYISWQKNILTVDYPEIRRFREFVRQYTTPEEYCEALVQLGRESLPIYSEAEAERFLADNTWEKRVDLICGLLRECR